MVPEGDGTLESKCTNREMFENEESVLSRMANAMTAVEDALKRRMNSSRMKTQEINTRNRRCLKMKNGTWDGTWKPKNATRDV
ncbi:hypothetical protein AVEN_120233-1 [Araneus ventricosus]|uniref:Uncharacterized protein n=1 Tax=Araneus ventricosus TaxID=182803 RepID=A0A4Y2RMA0_ARAVE|nr:hypothetical protein AVEN_120233-1 [Araneus ventricosus]